LDTWVEKHKPTSIKELALEQQYKDVLSEYLEKNNCPNMLLSGHAGIGKSTIAQLIPKFIEDSVSLYINASDENGIDTVRNKIKEFVSAAGFGGLKILILDEADGLSEAAQKSLRNVIESDLEDTRFILTCNYPGKIIEPIKSRCPEIHLSFSTKDVMQRLVQILQAEGISINKSDIIKIQTIVDKCFPDIRKTIGYLERCFVTGKFVEVSVRDTTGAEKIVEMILDNCRSFEQIKKCREYWLKNEPEFASDYSTLGTILYNAVESHDKYGNEPELLITLSTHLYQLDNSIDKEVQFHAACLELLPELR
jgi:DNA polymerase III delta prime subunit